jgi:hypothetical protein
VEKNDKCCELTRIFVRMDGILIIEDFLPLDEVKSLKSACDRLVQVSLLPYVSSLNKSSLDASNLTSTPAEKRSTFHCCVPAVINFLERIIKDDIKDMLLHFVVDSLAAGNGPCVLAVITFWKEQLKTTLRTCFFIL